MINNVQSEEEVYFYHPDHLDPSSWIYNDPEIHTTSQPEIFVSSPRQKPPMNRHLTYRTQTSQIPADCVCEDAETSISLRIATEKNTTFAPSNNRV